MTKVLKNVAVALIENESGKALNPDETATLLKDVFHELGELNPSLIPIHAYENAGRDCSIGFSVADKSHLVPTFNMVAVTSMQCEFTAHVKSKGYGFLSLSQEHIAAMRKYASALADAAHTAHADTDNPELALLCQFSRLEIGTIGCRSTNRDMSFEIHIEYIPTDRILAILDGHVKIENKDKRNRQRSFGYTLTCKAEVEAFVSAIGIEEAYLKAVGYVEQWQERNGLPEAYDGERVADYQNKTLVHKVLLAA